MESQVSRIVRDILWRGQQNDQPRKKHVLVEYQGTKCVRARNESGYSIREGCELNIKQQRVLGMIVVLDFTFELIQVLEDILINGVHQKDHFNVLLRSYFQKGGFFHLFD